jgi:hypothetical protein
MTHEEALSKLELEEGATSSEINTQYQEFYNEFQMRITNAPTEHQRKLYQKKLEELAAAFEVLGGENPESNTQELPGISVSEVVETEKSAKPSVSNQAEMSKEKALQFLGLGEKFTSKELENAFRSKVSSCEKGRDNAINASIRNAYEEAIIECDYAHKLLKEYIFLTPPIAKVARPTTQISNDNSASKKKWLLPISILSGVIILIILFFVFGNGSSSTNEPINPANHDEYVSLKSQADLLAKQGNWQEALTNYKKAYSLVETSEVKDSIESMKNQLLLVLKVKEVSIARKEPVASEKALKETERLPKEKESKRIKIGDTYAGGIVFKIDASGEHGLVCAPKDQGDLKWEEAKSASQNLTLNGYSDWYLPSKDQLNSMYINIGQGSSIGNVGGFAFNYYWSSTENGNYFAWSQRFDGGVQDDDGKNYTYYVRAVRAF